MLVIIIFSVSIELESPVVVVPRSARSTQVLVAHLGRMSLSNRPGPPKNTTYKVRIRDISLASLDVADKLQKHRLTADSMRQIYDVSCGKPVLHNTALQFNIDLSDADDSSCQSESSSSLVVEPAVPTLRLDPAVRAAVLAVPRPSPLPASAHAGSTPLLIVNFDLPIFSVELRADLGEGERSLVDLSFREFSLNYKKTNEYETTLQVSLHSITMEDLTKDPDSKHRMLMVSHTPQMPPKAVFVSKSCPDFLTEHPGEDLASISSLHFAKNNYNSLPGQLNVIAEHKERQNKRQDSKCGLTPPCSPECGAPGESETGSEDRARDTDGDGEEETGADDNLVWVWVHTRDPRHPRFHDTFDKVSKLTKVEFNSLNLVVNIDSWVAVLDFFGIAGDDLPDTEPQGDHLAKETDGALTSVEEEGGITVTEMCIRSLSAVVVSARGEWCGARVARVRVAARRDAQKHTSAVRARLGTLALRDLTPHAPLWRDTLRTHSQHALTVEYNRLSAYEATVAGHETSLRIAMGPVSYVHTKRFVHELQAFTRDFGLLRRVIMQARLKVSVGDSTRLSRMRIALACEAPVIIVPVSGYSRGALAVQASRLELSNRFQRAGASGSVSTLTDPDA
ncbi:Vacuolar protein sorting-associated protein 13D, partial [Operophtera brumata]